MHGFSQRIPDGDTRLRDVCDTCSYVAYENPKLVAGAVVAHQGSVLLCRRAIEPRRGYWTLPAGYMELGETVEEAAMREAAEEANAAIRLDGILAVYSISRIGQVQVIFRASFAGPPSFSPGDETLEARMFDWAAIPWDALAFPSVHWSLNAWHDAGDRALGVPATNPATDRRGTGRITAEAVT